MFGPRYFAPRYFAERYWAPGREEAVVPGPVEGVFDIPRSGPGAFVYERESDAAILAHEDEVMLVMLASFLGEVNEEDGPVNVILR